MAEINHVIYSNQSQFLFTKINEEWKSLFPQRGYLFQCAILVVISFYLFKICIQNTLFNSIKFRIRYAKRPDWKLFHRPTTPLGIMGTRLGAPLKPLDVIYYFDVRGFTWGPLIWPFKMPRYASLSDGCSI